jgi:hypothetical protein
VLIFRVIPHKATNAGFRGRFELHSWLCAEKRMLRAHQKRGEYPSTGAVLSLSKGSVAIKTQSAQSDERPQRPRHARLPRAWPRC